MNERIYTIVGNAAPDGATDKDVRNVLASFGFTGKAVEKHCEVLSGGEKIRLAFARIFINPPNLLILDEPTTHLDVAAREGLQEAIIQYNGTVCLVSHDIEFVRNSVSTIVAMDGKMGIKKYFGDYDYYREKTGQEVAVSSETLEVGKKSKPDKNKHHEADRQAQEARRRKKRLEQKVSKLETTIDTWIEEKEKLSKELSENTQGIDFCRSWRTVEGFGRPH